MEIKKRKIKQIIIVYDNHTYKGYNLKAFIEVFKLKMEAFKK